MLAAELLQKAGRNGDAEKHLRQAFEAAPSFALYERLDKLGDPLRSWAVDLLEGRLGKPEFARSASPSLLLEILMRQKMFDRAWSAARRHTLSPYITEALAKASEKTHPREAVETYAGLVEQLVRTGGNRGYEQAVKLIARMKALQDKAEYVRFVTALKLRHGRKRNFMKLLG